MKRIYTITTIIMAALAIAGCAKELEENNQVLKEDPKEEPKDDPKVEDGTMLLGAMLPDYPDASDYDAAVRSADTKTTISDNGDKTYSVHWAEGDAISVNGKTSKNININLDNPKSATFTLDVVDAPYCAVYPAGAASDYATDTSASGNKGEEGYAATVPAQVTVTVPSVQKYVANGIDPDAAIMYAYSESADKPLAFKHAMAYLKLTVDGAAVKSVRVNGNHNEMMSGDFILSYNTTENVFGAKPESGTNKPKGNVSVKYLCGGGDAAIPAGTPMFIAIPATLYENGLTLTVIDDQDHYQVIKSMTPFTATSGKVYPTEISFSPTGTYIEGGIYTVEDWNSFIQDLNAKDYSKWVTTVGNETGIHIMADIECQTNLESSSAAGEEYSLNHMVYGHGHTIKHKPVRQLFTFIGTDGGVSDLTVEGEASAWDNTGWAGIFATNNKGTLLRCVNKVNLTLGKASEGQAVIVASGICRTNTGTVKDCENYGSITIIEPDKEVRAGGVLVYNNGGTFTGCKNYGKIDVSKVDVKCVVGGVAFASNGAADALENHGDISIDANLTARRVIYLGGVLANAEYDNKCSKLTNCKNSGSLSIKKSGKFFMQSSAIGGVVASINKGAKGTEGDTFTGLTNCSNSGSISFNESETEGTHFGYAFGGVVGRCVNVQTVHYLNDGYYAVFRSLENTGDITVCTANGQKAAIGNSGARQTYVGGLVGFACGASASDKAIVRGKNNCTITTGSVSGGDIAGGLVGGGAMLSIDTKPSATTTFKSNNGMPVGFWGAALGWATSRGDVTINGAEAAATFESGSVVPIGSGFAGVTKDRTLSVISCQYNGKAVSKSDIYGAGTKSVK